jgi:hypothetical protein
MGARVAARFLPAFASIQQFHRPGLLRFANRDGTWEAWKIAQKEDTSVIRELIRKAQIQ